MWRLLVVAVVSVGALSCSDPSDRSAFGSTSTTTSPSLTAPSRTSTTGPPPASPTPSETIASSPTSVARSETTVTETSTVTTPEPLGVLVFHKTAGFTHQSIPAGVEAITGLGSEHGFEVTSTDDAAIFSDTGLRPFDVIVFLNTTGDILNGEQEQAMEHFIEDGGGFVGVHSAADTEYEWPWYERLVGAHFARHPEPQPALIEVLEPQHPVMRNLPQTFERFDEWYDFRDRPEAGAVVLATVDEDSYQGGRMGDPHPVIWASESLGGRSLYTGFGHTIDSFAEPLVLDHLANGLLWAGRSERAAAEG